MTTRMVYTRQGGMMNTLKITNEGKLCLEDFRSIHRAILIVLYDGPKKVRDLVLDIQRRYHEFKYLKVNVVVNALGELIKQQLVISTYTEDY